ncbi:hypothetical protein ACFL5W_01680 [Thermodesulfobacteriota bacterium]
MALEYVRENLDGLDEGIAKLYIQNPNGDGFIVDISEDVKLANKDHVPIGRLNQEIERRKATEKELQEIADGLRKDVPENMADLIPDLPPSKLIAWLRKANAQGVFSPKSAKEIDTQRPGDKTPKDFDNMTPQAIMATGYKTK